MQSKQKEWHDQWSMLACDELFLFKDWIAPYTLDDFKNKEVLECGCGGGQHTGFIAPFAKHITAVDLNTIDIARERNKNFKNITFLEGDIASMNLGKKFDIVMSIGVVHHTDNPTITVENLKKHLKKGGLLLLWVYSAEGNEIMRHGIEPFRKRFLKRISRRYLIRIAKLLTFMMYLPAYTLYRTKFRFLPYFEYIQNFRKLSYNRNVLNVFDKLNAPQTFFISKEKAHEFGYDLENYSVTPYKNVSYRISGFYPTKDKI
jgi:SAM-dependent methyltransferase